MKTKRLILAGGGHTHALVLRKWAMQPRFDTELLLISPTSRAAYSGSLPAAIAGMITIDAMHIDLRRLAKAAGAVFIDDALKGVDTARRQIILQEHPPLSFDLLSINLGSIPKRSQVPGASRWAIPLKPVDDFLKDWSTLCKETRSQPHKIVVVGGGAGGVELALSMQFHLQQRAQISLVQASPSLLPHFNRRTQRFFTRELQRRGINLLLGKPAAAVVEGKLILTGGGVQAFDRLYWATDASPPPCLQESGLLTNSQGFLSVDATLLCEGQSGIFAVGDCAAVTGQARAKSGVFAVRQAEPLFFNLRAALDAKPLRKMRLQKNHLALIGTGEKRAVATRGPCMASGQWMWRWKNAIDQRFMRKFSSLPLLMNHESKAGSPPPSMSAPAMRCLGCGAKVGAHILSDVLQQITRDFPGVLGEGRLEWGLNAREDVTLWQVPKGQSILQSIDYFPSLLDDAFRAGQIACNHAFNDILVKGAQAHSALVLAIITHAAEGLMRDQLYQLMAGIASQLQLLGASLAGGHSAEGTQFGIGLTVSGTAAGGLLRKDSGVAGDALILTKPLGTGLIFAAEMQGRALSRWIDGAVASMLQSQHALLPQLVGVHAATDVTGFGFLGHLSEMLRPGHLKATLQAATLPYLAGAREIAAMSISSSLYPANSRFQEQVRVSGSSALDHLWTLWGDPQTAGGFMLSVAASEADLALQTVHKLGFSAAQIIGHLQPRASGDAAIEILA